MTATTAVTCLALLLGGCSPSAGEEAAQAAYDACRGSADKPLLRHDGESVAVVLDDEDVELLAAFDAGEPMSSEDISAALLAGEDIEGYVRGAAVALAVETLFKCLIEETGAQAPLRSGDTWGGWVYQQEASGVDGVASALRFTATS